MTTATESSAVIITSVATTVIRILKIVSVLKIQQGYHNCFTIPGIEGYLIITGLLSQLPVAPPLHGYIQNCQQAYHNCFTQYQEFNMQGYHSCQYQTYHNCFIKDIQQAYQTVLRIPQSQDYSLL